jgi:hypothetical protein
MGASAFPRLCPARYSPWSKGRYEVAPNLRPFGTDFGNGVLDQRLFQFDSDWLKYFESKQAAIAENPSKYIARRDLREPVERAVTDLMLERLLHEWPELFIQDGGQVRFLPTDTQLEPDLGRLCLYLQEDLAVVVKEDNRDWIAYIHVCHPSHWLPTEKIGLSFFESHVPIPGFEKVNAAAGAMVESIITRGPFVRFVWGLESDAQLNHHPIAAPGRDQTEWYGRQFDKALFVRVERQVLWPLPEVSAALFTIRPIVYDADSIRQEPESWSLLVQAVYSMSPEARAYKGIPTGLKLT